jgi:predicted RNase H-like HicB family nuclease
MNHRKYAVVIEKGPTSFGAYVPDLPGCVAVAETRTEVGQLIAEAITFHIEGLREDGSRSQSQILKSNISNQRWPEHIFMARAALSTMVNLNRVSRLGYFANEFFSSVT